MLKYFNSTFSEDEEDYGWICYLWNWVCCNVSSVERVIPFKRANLWLKIRFVYNFVMETREYKDPFTFGWRIKYRRFFLAVGTLLFTYLTIYFVIGMTRFYTNSPRNTVKSSRICTKTGHSIIDTANFSSKEEIQTLLDFMGTNLTWPEGRSALDDVFSLYNTMQRTRSYIMIASSLLFWASLVLDFRYTIHKILFMETQ